MGVGLASELSGRVLASDTHPRQAGVIRRRIIPLENDPSLLWWLAAGEATNQFRLGSRTMAQSNQESIQLDLVATYDRRDGYNPGARPLPSGISPTFPAMPAQRARMWVRMTSE